MAYRARITCVVPIVVLALGWTGAAAGGVDPSRWIDSPYRSRTMLSSIYSLADWAAA